MPREMLWTVVAMPPVLTVLLDQSVMRRPWTDTLASMAGTGIYSLACALTTHALFEVLLERVHSRLTQAWRVVLYALVSGAAILAVTHVVAPIVRLVHPEMTHDIPNLARQGVVVTWLYILLGFSTRAAQDRLLAATERGLLERNHALEARLRALTARTNPHFLFNSLNAGMSLIATQPERAEELLGRLASLFRYALDNSAKRWVRLEDELSAVRDYLEIEHTRFGERLRFVIEMEPGLEGHPVPPMILQPLAENAVLHGLQSRVQGGTVWVRIARHEDALRLVVEDDGVGLEASAHRGSGTALSDLCERLEILYEGRAKHSCRARAEGGTRSEISLPWVPR